MRIVIEYESSWQNSFLSNETTKGDMKRKFIATSSSLDKNFKVKKISHDTVMGILNRLIGEQKKLYAARGRSDYYFKDMETLTTFKDSYIETQEVVYLRNIDKNSVDQKAFAGVVKASDLAFTSEYSLLLWGIIFLDREILFSYIYQPDDSIFIGFEKLIHPVNIKNRLASLKGKIQITDKEKNILDKFDGVLEDIKIDGFEESINISTIYSLALYWQLKRLGKHFDISSVLSPTGKLTGIALSGTFTEKDFMARYSTGGNKKAWGSPYLLRPKKFTEVPKMLTKASGVLEINLEISKDRARDLEEKIENAGVSAFYLGKKGLAYVKEIRI